MAKKRRKKAHSSKKRSTKKRRRKSSAAGAALRMRTGETRAKLHRAAAMLHDFHGGKLPIKSGCGRPRKKRRA